MFRKSLIERETTPEHPCPRCISKTPHELGKLLTVPVVC
jgi:hypothetical protein